MRRSNQVSLELDMVIDETDFPIISNAWEMYYGVKSEVVTWSGPGGGCPIVRFTGEESDVWEMVYLEFTNEHEDDTDFLMSGAEDVAD